MRSTSVRRARERAPFGVVVPVRAFTFGNTRLAAGLDPAARAELSRNLATRSVEAAQGAPVVVVTSAPEVVAWGASRGLDVVPDPGSLDAAARAGAVALAGRGCRRVVIAHADLPFARDYRVVTHDAGMPLAVVVPCHRDDGTPVLSLPAAAAADFGYAYGPGSFRRHLAAARAAGLAVRVVRVGALAFDVDTLADVDLLEQDDPTLLGTRRDRARTDR